MFELKKKKEANFQSILSPHVQQWTVILSRTFVTCGEERGPFRLALFICSDDALFFPGCNIPCLVVCPSAFFFVSGILQYTNKVSGLLNYIFREEQTSPFFDLLPQVEKHISLLVQDHFDVTRVHH